MIHNRIRRPLGRLTSFLAALTAITACAAAQQPYTLATIPVPADTLRNIGSSFSSAGDVNGDGAPDILAGSPYNDSPSGDPITDSITFSGAPGAGFEIWTPSTGAIVRSVIDPSYSTRGFALINLGDVDNDGRPDHAVSNPTFTAGTGINFAGRVDAYSGANGNVLWSFVSTVPGSQAGASLARIADVDQDGTADLLIGSPGMSGVAGRVFVVSGRTGVLLRVHGGGTGDALGWGTSDVGDVDGDAVSDYAAGAPQTAVLGATQPAGYVRIWSGASGAAVRTIAGVSSFDRFGRALAPAGDLNGDAVPDLFVGAPARFGQALPGRVVAISGANGSTLFSVSRNVAGDRFGWSLAAVGDRNGDGRVDCAVGTTVGVVEVRSGLLGGVIATQTGILSQTTSLTGVVVRPVAIDDVSGDSVGDLVVGAPNAGENGLAAVFSTLFGSPFASRVGDDVQGSASSAAAVGDLDGDGIRDLAIGNALRNGPGLGNVGSVLLWSTGAQAPIASVFGTSSEARFGSGLATLDDVDHDGVEDFIVGAINGSGAVTCHSGATRALLYTVNGPIFGGAFGLTLTRLSDVDGDNVRDFAVGAPYTAVPGVGATTGQVYICSGQTGAILRVISGLVAGEFFGATIADIGDVNGDGIADILVGAPYASPAGVSFAGVARIVSVGSGAVLRTHAGSGPGIALGYGVCGVGDADGDSVGDYAIASPANTASGASSAGPVVIRSGLTGALIRSIAPSPIPPGFVVNDEFGRGLANAGDLDGDGQADICLGAAPWLGFPPVQSREIHAYSVATGALIARQTASGGFVPFTPAVNATGFDLSGDGAPDWLTVEYPTTTSTSVRIMSRTGVPTGSTTAGIGCNLAAGQPPVLQSGGGDIVASIGAPVFDLMLSRAEPLRSGLLTIGGSNTSIGALALPLDLTIMGIPGCTLYDSADGYLPLTTTAAGLRGIRAPLPVQPSLAGAIVHLQIFMADATGAVVSSTNGLTLVVQ